MTETPVVTARQLIRVLRTLGFVQTREDGSFESVPCGTLVPRLRH